MLMSERQSANQAGFEAREAGEAREASEAREAEEAENEFWEEAETSACQSDTGKS